MIDFKITFYILYAGQNVEAPRSLHIDEVFPADSAITAGYYFLEKYRYGLEATAQIVGFRVYKDGEN